MAKAMFSLGSSEHCSDQRAGMAENRPAWDAFIRKAKKSYESGEKSRSPHFLLTF